MRRGLRPTRVPTVAVLLLLLALWLVVTFPPLDASSSGPRRMLHLTTSEILRNSTTTTTNAAAQHGSVANSARTPKTRSAAPAAAVDVLQPRFTTIAVIGERHSGTNAVRLLLETNLDRRFHVVRTNFTEHKHYLQPVPPHRHPRTLVVMSVRNAYDWVAAMHKLCYCCENRSRLALDEFLSRPFQSTNVVGPNAVLCPDIDHNIFAGGRPFRNLLDMREWKLLNHLNSSK